MRLPIKNFDFQVETKLAISENLPHYRLIQKSITFHSGDGIRERMWDKAKMELGVTKIKEDLFGVAYGANQFVAVGQRGKVITSGDGQLWLTQPPATEEDLWGITFGDSKFTSVGTGGAVTTSENAIQWTRQESGTFYEDLYTIIHDGSRFISLGSRTFKGGATLISPDGATWERFPSGTNEYLRGIATSGSLFVAVGANGTILSSPDGESWTPKPSGTSEFLWDITHNGTQFIAVGDKGTILTSPDGDLWIHQTSGTTQFLRGIASTNSEIVAVGDKATIIQSADGVEWKTLESETNQNLSGVTTSGWQFIAVGDEGTVVILD